MDAPAYTELSASAQTAYAQLFDAALALGTVRSVEDLTGSFNAKTVKGRKYWYFQYTETGGKLRQIYVGPDTEAVQRLVNRKAGASSRSLDPMIISAIAYGCAGVVPRHFRVIRRLADYGFFRAGGVLVGTHAFLAYGNMLGVRWGETSHTQDIDFAHAGKAISLGLPNNLEINTDSAIKSLQMGFLPARGLAGELAGTYLIPQEPEFRLDFLTPMHRDGEAPYVHPGLGVPLQPLKFMEFSLEEAEQAVVFCRDGAVVLNVPSPERYAIHKLIVEGASPGAVTRNALDVAQAAALMSYLVRSSPERLVRAYEDAVNRGKGWAKRVSSGMASLARRFPEHEALKLLAGTPKRSARA